MQFEFLFERNRIARPENEWLRVGARHVRLRFARHPRARRYVLRLCSDGTARVTIPRGGSPLEGRRFANRNLGWLEKQLLRQASRPAESKVWTVGTEILFRGEKARLEFSEAENVVRFADEAVRLHPHKPRSSRGEIRPEGLALGKVPSPLPECSNFKPRLQTSTCDVRCSMSDVSSRSVSPRPFNLRPLIEKHLWQLASRELPLRVWDLAKQHAFHVRRVTVRNQRSRWGSCSKHCTISLNWRLVQTPLFVCDYIILHELAHLKEMNHSRRFWREVARLCPDFARAERWLKEHADLFR